MSSPWLLSQIPADNLHPTSVALDGVVSPYRREAELMSTVFTSVGRRSPWRDLGSASMNREDVARSFVTYGSIEGPFESWA